MLYTPSKLNKLGVWTNQDLIENTKTLLNIKHVGILDRKHKNPFILMTNLLNQFKKCYKKINNNAIIIRADFLQTNSSKQWGTSRQCNSSMHTYTPNPKFNLKKSCIHYTLYILQRLVILNDIFKIKLGNCEQVILSDI